LRVERIDLDQTPCGLGQERQPDRPSGPPARSLAWQQFPEPSGLLDPLHARVQPFNREWLSSPRNDEGIMDWQSWGSPSHDR